MRHICPVEMMTEDPGDRGVEGSSRKDIDKQPVMDLEAPKLLSWKERLMMANREGAHLDAGKTNCPYHSQRSQTNHSPATDARYHLGNNRICARRNKKCNGYPLGTEALSCITRLAEHWSFKHASRHTGAASSLH